MRGGQKPKGLQPEDRLFAKLLCEKWQSSGLSQNKYFKGIGLKFGQTHFSNLMNGKRGLSFYKAVRIANAAGIDLGDIQKEIKP